MDEENIVKIEVTTVTTHEDGSATLVLDVDNEALEFLTSIAIRSILRDALNDAERGNIEVDKPVDPSKED